MRFIPTEVLLVRYSFLAAGRVRGSEKPLGFNPFSSIPGIQLNFGFGGCITHGVRRAIAIVIRLESSKSKPLFYGMPGL